MKDPRTGETVVSSEEIKRVNLEHCVKELKSNVPNKEVEELLKVQSERHDNMMLDDTDKDTTIDEGDFKEVLAKLKKKNKKNFYFLRKSGEKFQNSVFKLSKRIFDEESFPKDFAMTTLETERKQKRFKQSQVYTHERVDAKTCGGSNSQSHVGGHC